MLILDTRKVRPFPVTFDQPQDDGSFRARTFTGQWHQFGQTEVDADRKAVAEGKLKDLDIATKYWAGWKEGDIQLPDGSTLPCNDDTRAQVLNLEGMRGALVKAWMKLIGAEGK